MARSAVRAKQAQAAQHAAANQSRKQRKHASGGNPNQDLFFTRLRRRQRWVFILLAIMFAVTFAALGVGSGGGGGLEQDFVNLFGSGSDPVGAANAEIKTNPAKGWKDLAKAYVTVGNPDGAVTALQEYLKLKKTDASAWEQLGGLQRGQADLARQQYQQVAAVSDLRSPSTLFQPTKLANTLGTNQIDQYYSQQLSAISSPLYQKASADYQSSLTSFENAAKYASPANRAAAWFPGVYTAAQLIGNQKVELQALQQYVQLSPNTPRLKQLEATCKSLGGSCTPPAKKPAHKKK